MGALTPPSLMSLIYGSSNKSVDIQQGGRNKKTQMGKMNLLSRMRILKS